MPPNMALHRTTIPLCSIAVGGLGRYLHLCIAWKAGFVSQYPRGKPRGIKSAASRQAAQALARVGDDARYT